MTYSKWYKEFFEIRSKTTMTTTTTKINIFILLCADKYSDCEQIFWEARGKNRCEIILEISSFLKEFSKKMTA